MISKISSVSDLTEFGRVQLSPNFFMHDMLYSEVANFDGDHSEAYPGFPKA